MGLFRTLWSLLRGTSDRDAYNEYRNRLIGWAEDAHGLSPGEYQREYARRYVDGSGRDLFLDYLVSLSKNSPSYLSEEPLMLADRKKLFDRFGLPVLTMRELRDLENDRLKRMKSPLRL